MSGDTLTPHPDCPCDFCRHHLDTAVPLLVSHVGFGSATEQRNEIAVSGGFDDQGADQ